MRWTVVWALMVVVLGWMPTAAHADGPTWQRLQVAHHAVSVELPGKTFAGHESSNWGPFGTAETDSINCRLQGGEMAALATAAPAWAVKGAGNDLIFLTTRDTLLRKRKGHAKSWEKIVRNGLEGKRLVYTVNGEVEQVGTMEVFVTGSTILTFDALLPKDAPSGDVERFFASIKVKGH